MAIVDIGLTYRDVPAELLERLLVASHELPEMLHKLRAVPATREAVVISTCNRLEAYVETRQSPDSMRVAFAATLAPRASMSAEDVAPLLFAGDETHAVEHLFTVACGLDSMAVGEDQIVAQIRAAGKLAGQAHTIGPVLTRLVDAALTTSKRARTETGIGRRGISLAHAGLEMADQSLSGLSGRTALVLGAGTVGSLVARLLRERGAGRLVVASRTEASARRLADATGAQVEPIENLAGLLADCDLVVTAMGAAAPVLTAARLTAARSGVPARQLFVLDLAMPRDADPACAHLPGVTLVDIETLGKHLADRRLPDDVGHVRAVIAEEVAAFLVRRREAAAGPLIGALHSRAQQAVEAELNRLRFRLTGLDDEQRAETAAAVQRVVGKLLHAPTVRARELSATPGGGVYIDALTHLFDLSGSEA